MPTFFREATLLNVIINDGTVTAQTAHDLPLRAAGSDPRPLTCRSRCIRVRRGVRSDSKFSFTGKIAKLEGISGVLVTQALTRPRGPGTLCTVTPRQARPGHSVLAAVRPRHWRSMLGFPGRRAGREIVPGFHPRAVRVFFHRLRIKPAQGTQPDLGESHGAGQGKQRRLMRARLASGICQCQ